MKFTPSWLKDPLETNAPVTEIVGAILPGDAAFVDPLIAKPTSASSVS